MDFEWILEEFIYPPMPCHGRHWPERTFGAMKNYTFYIALGLLKIIFLISCAKFLDKTTRRRQVHPFIDRILRHPVSRYFLRVWLPIRVLAPNIMTEVGALAELMIRILPSSLQNYLLECIANTSFAFEWLEILLMIASLWFISKTLVASLLAGVARYLQSEFKTLSHHRIHRPHLRRSSSYNSSDTSRTTHRRHSRRPSSSDIFETNRTTHHRQTSPKRSYRSQPPTFAENNKIVNEILHLPAEQRLLEESLEKVSGATEILSDLVQEEYDIAEIVRTKQSVSQPAKKVTIVRKRRTN